MVTSTFPVTGMTCGHCAQAVTSELTKLSGVSGVTVTSDGPLAEQAVREALDEAGGYLIAAG